MSKKILISQKGKHPSQQLTAIGNFPSNADIDNQEVGITKAELDAAIDNIPAPTPVDSRPYKVYTALLTQTGTNAPVATVLENTLGGTPVWTRDDAGIYIATLTSAFVRHKTWITVGTSGDGYDDTQVSSSGLYGDIDTIRVHVNDLDKVGYDGYLYGAPIEIRVYN